MSAPGCNLNEFISTERMMPFVFLHYHLVFTRHTVNAEASHKRMIGDKMGCLFRQQLPALFQSRESVFHSCWAGEAHRSKQLAALSAGAPVLISCSTTRSIHQSFLYTRSSCLIAKDQCQLRKLLSGLKCGQYFYFYSFLFIREDIFI